MKLASTATTFEGRLPAGARHSFVIKSNPHLFNILSDGIYSDKIAAVIRELSCNAHDSNVMGKSPTPFIVNVPSKLDNNFWVEDTGLGIDPDKIVDIFWTYGASTKTQSNETIGALGLGSKSPFAYTKSSFLVVNRYNGIEYKYFCFINEVGIPDGKLMYQSATTEPNGVRVELAVRVDDLYTFRQRIIRFFSFWDVSNLPQFEGDDSVLKEIMTIKATRTVGSCWELRSTRAESLGQKAYAVMGGVPYPINLQALGTPSEALTMVCNTPLNIKFPMGSLDFQVSREELSYTEETIKTLEQHADAIAKDLVKASMKKLVGFTTLRELCIAYRDEQKRLSEYPSFQHIKNLLERETHALADGRTFIGSKLHASSIQLKRPGHLPFNIQRLEQSLKDYAKGTQRYSLEDALMIELALKAAAPATPLAGTGPVVQSYQLYAVIPWFKASTQPVDWTNTNRKRTAANYLHAGFEALETKFDHDTSKLTAAFIVNDLQEQGAEGVRFYAGQLSMNAHLDQAFSSGRLYFVDGSAAALSHSSVEAALSDLIKDTHLEGAPIVRLSKLYDFKLPEAKKATPKPRAPVQRGTVEQRTMVFKLGDKPNIEPHTVYVDNDSFQVEFEGILNISKGYFRHSLSEPMLYIDANWGAPATPHDKTCVDSKVIGALYSLGLLDNFVHEAHEGRSIRVCLLSPNHVVEMQERKVKLVKVSDILQQTKALFDSDVELHAAFHARIDKDSDFGELFARLTSSVGFMKFCLNRVPDTNPLKSLAYATRNVKRLLQGDLQRSALLFLADVLDLKGALSGTAGSESLKRYILLPSMSFSVHSYTKEMHEQLAAYFNAVDEQQLLNAEAAKLKTLEALHAEAIFDLS